MTRQQQGAGEWRPIIQAALEEKSPNFLTPADTMETAVANLIHNALNSAWDRWACDNEACPGRPEWDRALSLLWDRADNRIRERIWRVIYGTLERELEQFAVAYPDAPRKAAAA